MNVLVTGASGFIGNNLIRQLLKSNFKIFANSRKPISFSDGIVTYVNSELIDIPIEILESTELIIHCAAHSVQFPFDSLENNINFNLNVTLKFLSKAFNSGVKKHIFLGTCYEYGLSSNNYEYIPPAAELFPLDTYSFSKACAFSALRMFWLRHDIKIQYLRLFHVYGLGQNQNRLWPSLKNAAEECRDFVVKDSHLIRDFIDVNKVSKIIQEQISFFDNMPDNSDFFIKNIASGIPLTIGEFVSMEWKKSGAKGNLIFEKENSRGIQPKRIVADLSGLWLNRPK